jgi:hypothetical protein
MTGHTKTLSAEDAVTDGPLTGLRVIGMTSSSAA